MALCTTKGRSIPFLLTAATVSRIPRRDGSSRVKKKWASQYKPTGASHLALEYMDAHYPRLYGEKKWPLIRCALLSRPKYGLLVNPYLDTTQCHAVMLDVGAFDALDEARERLKAWKNGETPEIVERLVPPVSTEDDFFDADDELYQFQEALDSRLDQSADASLDFFLPPKKLYHRAVAFDIHEEEEEREEEKLRSAMRDPHPVVEERVPEKRFAVEDIPESLSLGLTIKGSVETYPTPYHQFDRLGYYLFDAASILPVVALDLKDDDSVADLCAAPGGKTLALLFAKRAQSIVAIDKSFSRMERFKEVMFSYIPKPLVLLSSPDNVIQFFTRDALAWRPPKSFNKILVDVPCSNDRLSVTDDENNVFSPGKRREREGLPEYQALLLNRAYELCQPGGEVVYSTCTLSPSQNDGVIRRFFEKFELFHPHQPKPVVVDLNSFIKLFARNFSFYGGCQYGIQVIPSLKANFGPMYISKLKKPEI